MSLFSKVRGALGLKQAPGVKFPSSSMVFWGWDDITNDTIAANIGDGTESDVLMTPIRWIQRSMLEAPIITVDEAGDPIADNALLDLLRTPTPFYAWEVLVGGTTMSLSVDGNAYWIAALNEDGTPVELWYAPHMNMEPRWPQDDPTKFITHYDYDVAGEVQHILPFGHDAAEVPAGIDITEGLAVIQFREGVDPKNIRKGLSPLKGLMREVWTDNEAAKYTAALLRNHGVPGVVVSPTDKDATIDVDQADAAKAKIESSFTGENRGRALVMLGPTRVDQFGFSPKDMDLSPLRDVAEERVTAALGVASAVVGFGSGLQATKVGATMTEMRKMSWTQGVIPVQGIIAGEVGRTLAPTFNAGGAEFDNTGVEALRENEDTKAARVGRLYRDNVITRAEARSTMGLESDPSDEVYLANVVAFGYIPQGERRLEAPAQPADVTEAQAQAVSAGADAADAGADGNGGGDAETRAAIADIMAKQHQHSATEVALFTAAPRAKPTAATTAIADAIERIKRDAGPQFVNPLVRVFTNLGLSAERATEEVLADPANADILAATATDEQRADPDGAETKQTEPGDALITEQILALTDTEGAQVAFVTTLEEGYLQIAAEVTDVINDTLGVEFALSDEAQNEILRQGGLNAGLVDLEDQTREAIFDGLAEAREQGMTSDNLARFIRDRVEAGPWRDAATRAKVIARTEGANAANVSTLEVAKDMDDTEHVQVFDNRTGHGDLVCTRADGSIITIEQAEAVGLAHPNCTRSFVPLNALLMEEMEISGPMSRIDPQPNPEGATP